MTAWITFARKKQCLNQPLFAICDGADFGKTALIGTELTQAADATKLMRSYLIQVKGSTPSLLRVY